LLSAPLLVFLIVPLAALFLRTSPGNLIAHLRQPQVFQAIRVNLTTTAAIILLGTPLAYFLARRALPLRRAIDILIDLPTVLLPAVVGVALLVAFVFAQVFIAARFISNRPSWASPGWIPSWSRLPPSMERVSGRFSAS